MSATAWGSNVTGKRHARRWLTPLGVRLAAAFVIVAVAAVAVLGVLSVIAARDEVSNLMTETHAGDARSAAVAAGRAYESAGGWDGADLSAAVAVAARGQATLTVADANGAVVTLPMDEAAEMMGRMHGIEVVDVPRADPVAVPVVIDGEQVGSVALRFPASHLPTPERQARDALARTIVLGGLLAVAVAVAVAVIVARRVAAPVTALTSAATAVGAGRRGVRVNQPDAPGELGVLSAAFDQMAASVEREDDLRRQLVTDVAHEVRTPLTILRATTEGLVDGVIEPDRATLQSLHDEVLRLTDLVTDLETLAAADASALDLHRGPLDLAAVALAVATAGRASADDRDITITTDLRPAPAMADRRRVHQILTNLMVNAIRYTPIGGRITLETGQCSGGEPYATVADNGPGMTDDDLTRVFDRFYRGEAGRATPGTGIGLAIAVELASAHDGTITAANHPDGGAVFTLHLPSPS